MLQHLWEPTTKEEHEPAKREHIRQVGLEPERIAIQNHENISTAADAEKRKGRKKRDVLGGAIRTIPVPVCELDLDLPKSPLGRDLAPLGLDNLQTPIKRDARHDPLTPLPSRIQIAYVGLKLQSACLHLCHLHTCRLH